MMSSTVLTLPSWKQEPLSPPSNEESTLASCIEEAFLYSTWEQDTDLKLETDLLTSPYEDNKVEVASQLLEDLENLADLDELIKDEPFFLDVKMLPALDEMERSRYPVKVELPTQVIFDAASLCNIIEYDPSITTLTPPQSPPNTPMLTTLKPLVASQSSLFQTYQVEQETSLITSDNVLVYPQVDYPTSPQPDIAHELAVVDELVRSHVENMQWNSNPSSPGNSSSNSSFEDCSSSDPEWIPGVEENQEELQDNIKPRTQKRTKPYSRSVEDKKSRKKEQNKNAATRYRMKKKAEVEEILTEEKQLADVGEKLSNQITDIQREIKYLKGLMRDLFKAKGLIN